MHNKYEIPAIDYCDSLKIYTTGGKDKEINVRNVENDQLLISLKGHKDWVRSVIFSE
jgi:WD40 repeat protein